MTRSLSIIIPAYNEAARLPDTLRRILAYLEKSAWTFTEILVVDDGSTDATVAAAEQFPAVRVLRNPGNRGKGYSVKHGMLAGRGEWLLFTDADLSAPIEELASLWDAVERTTREKTPASIAIGSRALDPSLIGVHQPAFRETAGKFFNIVMRVVVRLPIRDTQCGFKLFEARAAKEIFSRQRLERFGFDVEDLFLARKLGYRVLEIAVHWNHAEGTKVDMWNGAQSFLDLFAIRLNQWAGKYR